MAGSRVLAHVVDQYPTPVLGIANASGTWYNGSSTWYGAEHPPRTLGQLQWTLGWNSADVRLNGTAIALHARAILWFFGNMDHTHRFESIAMGHPRAMVTVAYHQPRNMVLKFVRYLDVVWRADPQSLNLTKGLQRSFPSIRWTQQGKTIALQGVSGLQGSISSNPWTLTLSTPFRPGDGGRLAALTVLLGRPASTLTIPLQ